MSAKTAIVRSLSGPQNPPKMKNKINETIETMAVIPIATVNLLIAREGIFSIVVTPFDST